MDLVNDEQEGGIKYWSYWESKEKGTIQKLLSFLKNYTKPFEDIGKNLYSVSVFYNPGNEIPYHTHKRTTTIVKKIDGEGEIILNGERMPLPEEIYIPSNTPHRILGNNIIVLNMETPPDKDDFIKIEENR